LPGFTAAPRTLFQRCIHGSMIVSIPPDAARRKRDRRPD
jgi:hypothetical protein